MPICIVFKCSSSSRNEKDLKFHHIPSDPERCKQWITACKRIDLVNRSPKLLRSKFVCSLHFDKSMYKNKNLKHSATPTLSLTGNFQDSFTQTWESIKFIEPSEPALVKTESPNLTKIEVTTSYTQTEEFMFKANCNLQVKKENDNTDAQFKENNMQCNKLEIKTGTRIKEGDTEKTNEMKLSPYISISSDSTLESASGMSIDVFLRLSEGLKKQLAKELQKKNIPQTRILRATNSRLRPKDKGIQTGDVIVYDIPKNNQCFQQCVRCGKNAYRLNPLLKPDHRITLEEFETACERFLSPTFCATVKTEIMLNKLLNKNTDNKKKCNTKMMPFMMKNGSVNMALLSNNF